MFLRLPMLATLNRQAVPALSLLLSDLGDPSQRAIARALGVCPRTVARWIAQDQAPRCAMLALFWVSRWGRDQIAGHAIEGARLAHAMNAALTAENHQLRRELARVLVVGDFGSANDPTLENLHAPAEVIPIRPTQAG